MRAVQMLPRSAAGGCRGGCFAVPKLCMVLTSSLVSGSHCMRLRMLTSRCAQSRPALCWETAAPMGSTACRPL